MKREVVVTTEYRGPKLVQGSRAGSVRSNMSENLKLHSPQAAALQGSGARLQGVTTSGWLFP